MEEKEFQLKCWDGYTSTSRIVKAVSYEAAHNLHVAPLPPSRNATLVPVEEVETVRMMKWFRLAESK